MLGCLTRRSTVDNLILMILTAKRMLFAPVPYLKEFNSLKIKGSKVHPLTKDCYFPPFERWKARQRSLPFQIQLQPPFLSLCTSRSLQSDSPSHDASSHSRELQHNEHL
uniref:Uncharacterized protein MANES_12G042300 n=1 Tax=Rhizophora mucronata TaxID=61149 RepID=A0A2P2MA18_RHIMU